MYDFFVGWYWCTVYCMLIYHWKNMNEFSQGCCLVGMSLGLLTFWGVIFTMMIISISIRR